MKVGTRNNILFGIIWKLSGPSSMIGSNLENLEEHYLGVLMRVGATSPILDASHIHLHHLPFHNLNHKL